MCEEAVKCLKESDMVTEQALVEIIQAFDAAFPHAGEEGVDVLRSKRSKASPTKEGEDDEESKANKLRMQAKRVKCPRCTEPLKRFTTNYTGYSCNFCNRSQREGAHLFSCRDCNYDLCNACHHKQQQALILALQKEDEGKEKDEEEPSANAATPVEEDSTQIAYYYALVPYLERAQQQHHELCSKLLVKIAFLLDDGDKQREWRQRIIQEQQPDTRSLGVLTQLVACKIDDDFAEIEQIILWTTQRGALLQREQLGVLLVLLDWNHSAATCQVISHLQPQLWEMVKNKQENVEFVLALLSRLPSRTGGSEGLDFEQLQMVEQTCAANAKSDAICEQALAVVLNAAATCSKDGMLTQVQQVLRARFAV